MDMRASVQKNKNVVGGSCGQRELLLVLSDLATTTGTCGRPDGVSSVLEENTHGVVISIRVISREMGCVYYYAAVPTARPKRTSYSTVERRTNIIRTVTCTKRFTHHHYYSNKKGWYYRRGFGRGVHDNRAAPKGNTGYTTRWKGNVILCIAA